MAAVYLGLRQGCFARQRTSQKESVSRIVLSQLGIEPALAILQSMALVQDDVVPLHGAQLGCVSPQKVVAGQEHLKWLLLCPYLQSCSKPVTTTPPALQARCKDESPFVE